MTPATVCTNLWNTVLSETSLSQKDRYSVTPLLLSSAPWSPHVHRDREWLERQGLGEGRCCLMGTECQFCKVRRVLEISCLTV